ncbi:MAG: hypothetical protein ACOYL3_20975 [Desulfuromonadaceae bacterium]
MFAVTTINFLPGETSGNVWVFNKTGAVEKSVNRDIVFWTVVHDFRADPQKHRPNTGSFQGMDTRERCSSGAKHVPQGGILLLIRSKGSQ